MKTLDGNVIQIQKSASTMPSSTDGVPDNQLPDAPKNVSVPRKNLHVDKYTTHPPSEFMQPHNTKNYGKNFGAAVHIYHPDAVSSRKSNGLVGSIHLNNATGNYHVEHANGNSIRPIRDSYPSLESAKGGLIAEQTAHARGFRKLPRPKVI